MVQLFGALIKRLGLKVDEHDKRIDQIANELTETKTRLAEFEQKLGDIEQTVISIVDTFEKKYADLAKRGLNAREQSKRAIRGLREEIDLFIKIVESSTDAKLDAARQVQIAKLLKTARTKRTRLENLLARGAANAS